MGGDEGSYGVERVLWGRGNPMGGDGGSYGGRQGVLWDTGGPKGGHGGVLWSKAEWLPA